MEVTAYQMAERWIGTKELPGKRHNPFILGMLTLDTGWPEGDEVPWCSAFINFVCWLLRLPRSKSLRARSWLQVGRPVHEDDIRVGFDVVVLSRAGANEPGPEVLDAPGHVGFYAGRVNGQVYVLGGNQGNAVSVAGFPSSRVLGFRRLVA